MQQQNVNKIIADFRPVTGGGCAFWCINPGLPSPQYLFPRRFVTHRPLGLATAGCFSDIALIALILFSTAPHCRGRAQAVQLNRIQRPNRHNLRCSRKAVLPEAAVGVRAIPARRAVAWCAPFSQLDTMDKLGFLHLAGRYP